jgi:cyclase
MQIVEVRPSIFACLMANETANAGFVVTGRGVVVIDTLDRPARGHELAAAIKARTDRPIILVINTHHHYDHVFGNQAFDAPIVAHRVLPEQLAQAAARDLMPVALAARLSEHPEDRWLADELELTYPNVLFENRLTLNLPPVRMILEHLGGHTPDSCIVDLPDEGVVFSGDLVFEGRVPYLRQAHMEDTLKALRRLQRLGARIVVPGHGDVCDVTYVIFLMEYIESLQGKVKELIDRGWEKADVLDSDQLPGWWTDDRPDLLRANVARIYDQLAGNAGPP